MKKISEKELVALLRSGGFKATPGRLALLSVLASSAKPLGVPEIVAQLKGEMDQATVYRALDALYRSGILRRVELEHTHAHYEVVIPGDHHHHIVCTICGRIEDLPECATDDLEQQALTRTKAFATISRHSLEFFGVCRKCA